MVGGDVELRSVFMSPADRRRIACHRIRTFHCHTDPFMAGVTPDAGHLVRPRRDPEGGEEGSEGPRPYASGPHAGPVGHVVGDGCQRPAERTDVGTASPPLDSRGSQDEERRRRPPSPEGGHHQAGPASMVAAWPSPTTVHPAASALQRRVSDGGMPWRRTRRARTAADAATVARHGPAPAGQPRHGGGRRPGTELERGQPTGVASGQGTGRGAVAEPTGRAAAATTTARGGRR